MASGACLVFSVQSEMQLAVLGRHSYVNCKCQSTCYPITVDSQWIVYMYVDNTTTNVVSDSTQTLWITEG